PAPRLSGPEGLLATQHLAHACLLPRVVGGVEEIATGRGRKRSRGHREETATGCGRAPVGPQCPPAREAGARRGPPLVCRAHPRARLEPGDAAGADREEGPCAPRAGP